MRVPMIGTDTLKEKVQEKMRINVLQHTPNEGPGAIRAWAEENGHEKQNDCLIVLSVKRSFHLFRD